MTPEASRTTRECFWAAVCSASANKSMEFHVVVAVSDDHPRRTEFDHMVRLGWIKPAESIEVRFGTSRAGAVDVALYRTFPVGSAC